MLLNYLTLLLVVLWLGDVFCASRSRRGVPFVEKCPTSWRHPKCSCETSDLTNLATIQCTGITDASEIQTAFRQEWSDNSKRFDWFTLEDSVVTSLPEAVFGKYSFMGFIVSNSTITNIDDNAFQGSSSSCQYVWITKSNLTGFNFKALNVMKQLSSVSLAECHITKVPDNAFGLFDKLDTVSLDNNEIDQLGLNAFASLPKLRILDLSGNKIYELKNGQLKIVGSTTQQVVINLAKNNIASIETNAFSDMLQPPSELNLEDNKLQTLKEEIFSPLLDRMRKLSWSTMKVKGNPFNCDASMDWLLNNRSKYSKIINGLQCPDGRRPFDNEAKY